ncbi:EF-hand domain-containing protein [Gimesia aquarii]|uniref:Transaldolase/EF-hand domain-containing protein n=1 Tax=Gimesia aquarii TaxID=2527964 RepID=A0A517VRX6_9PLAN|nr:hypothetical protein [Gimesia aquarii]QDT95774.1 transaldolase/EF-hand domain-containing protein [Gimesia aquarii]
MRIANRFSVYTALLAVCATTLVFAQPPEGEKRDADRGDRPERRERGDRPERRDQGDRPERGDRGPGRRGPGGRPNIMTIMPIIIVLDANKDGEISKEEMENATAALQKLDKDKNGKLTEEELRPNFGRRDGDRRGPGGPEGRGPRDGDRRGPGGPEGRGPRDGDRGRNDGGDGDRNRNRGGDFIERIMKNDKNEDGKLTKDELPERMQPIFDRIDTNQDKVIDKDELKKMMERFQSRGRSGGRERGKRDSGKERPKRPELED